MPAEAKTLVEALLKAQSEFPDIVTSTPGQAGGARYLYASLPDILKQVLPVLHKNGLLVTQQPVEHNGDVWLQTTISHVSGETQSGLVPLPMPTNWQQWGSAVTYARRYSLTAMLGIAPDDDDDAAGAQPFTQSAPKASTNGSAGKRSLSNARMCPEHHQPWAQNKSGRFAHPIKDANGDLAGWCNEDEFTARETGAPAGADITDPSELPWDEPPARKDAPH